MSAMDISAMSAVRLCMISTITCTCVYAMMWSPDFYNYYTACSCFLCCAQDITKKEKGVGGHDESGEEDSGQSVRLKLSFLSLPG